MEPEIEALPLPPSSLVDWRNMQYREGTRVFYPITRGSSGYIVEAIVIAIEWDPYQEKKYKQGYRRTLPILRVKVRVMCDSTKSKRRRDWAYVGTSNITVAR